MVCRFNALWSQVKNGSPAPFPRNNRWLVRWWKGRSVCRRWQNISEIYNEKGWSYGDCKQRALYTFQNKRTVCILYKSLTILKQFISTNEQEAQWNILKNTNWEGVILVQRSNSRRQENIYVDNFFQNLLPASEEFRWISRNLLHKPI